MYRSPIETHLALTPYRPTYITLKTISTTWRERTENNLTDKIVLQIRKNNPTEKILSKILIMEIVYYYHSVIYVTSDFNQQMNFVLTEI